MVCKIHRRVVPLSQEKVSDDPSETKPVTEGLSFPGEIYRGLGKQTERLLKG